MAGGAGGRGGTDRDDGAGQAGRGEPGGRRPAGCDRGGLPSPGPRSPRRSRARPVDGSARPVGGSGRRASPVPAVRRDPRSRARGGAARVHQPAVRGDPGRGRARPKRQMRPSRGRTRAGSEPHGSRCVSRRPRSSSAGMRPWTSCSQPARRTRPDRAGSPPSSVRPASARPGSPRPSSNDPRARRHGPRRARARRRTDHRLRPDRGAAAFRHRGTGRRRAPR